MSPANKVLTKHALLTQYSYKIELHAHSHPASICGHFSPEELVQIYADLGYDAMVLTNHFVRDYLDGLSIEDATAKHLEDYHRARQAAQTCGLRVYLGVEARFTENSNDYLIYGADEPILRKIAQYWELGVEAFRREVPLPRSVFIQAHPFRDGMTQIDPTLLDGLEVYNMHPRQNSRNAVAAVYAREHRLTIRTAASDCHRPGDAGNTAIRTAVLPEDSFALAQILRSGDYLLQIGDDLLL